MKRFLLTLLLLGSALLHPLAAKTPYPFDVRVTGTGHRDVILIPGYSCSGEVWQETVRQLAPRYRCHVLTMPGFAGTKAEADPQLNGWADAIAAYIEREKLDHPIIIGHSLGGLLAMNLAAAHPGLPGRIVVVDALPCLPALQNPAFQPQAAPDCAAFSTRFLQMSAADLLRQQRMTAAQLTADTARVGLIAGWGAASDRHTLGQIFCQLLNTDLRPQLSRITAPTLVLLEAPFQTMTGSIEQQYAGLKGVRLAYATQGRHFVMYDDPQWYAQQLSTFLAE